MPVVQSRFKMPIAAAPHMRYNQSNYKDREGVQMSRNNDEMTVESLVVDYDLLLRQAQAFMDAERHFIPLLSNISALLKDTLRKVNWAGFYLVTEGGNLMLGPFQGKPACIRIEKGKGVCGTALANNETVCVPNVHDFPGHIACDSASLSEIVVPVRDSSGTVKAVLDIDSPMEDRFFDRDRKNLEQLCQMIGNKIRWEML